YFATIGATIVAGRDFDAHDRAASRATRGDYDVVIVNEALARRLFDGNVLGKQLQLEHGRASIIVGIARNLRDVSTVGNVPRAYFPLLESSFDQFDLLVRTDGDAASYAERIGASLRDETSAFPSVRTLSEIRDQSTSVSRAASTGLAGGAMVALFLMTIGIYGIVSMAAARRRHELGIRMALGAPALEVHRLLLSVVGRLIAIGAIIGLMCAAATILVERSWLGPILAPGFDTSAIALLVLLASAGMAAFAPSRRATRQPPAEVLRSL
ncbi:MAG TPA: FtsX-like permease family protein, partial [Gemmatimonadaceae bacterium]|nr:FtsX-like permease family protein [Gemmatimonadaceae bacterium]